LNGKHGDLGGVSVVHKTLELVLVRASNVKNLSDCRAKILQPMVL
jgi:hypothetical protein